MSGLSVEIGNTDAEGRLVMADVMTYVQRNFNPKSVNYIATLTGAISIALGKTTAGVFAKDKELAKQWKEAGTDSFEPVWPMPVNDEFRDAVKGKYGADLANKGDS